MNDFYEEAVPLINNEKAKKKQFIYKMISILGVVFIILGMFFAPVFSSNGKIFDFSTAIGYLNILFLVIYFWFFLFVFLFFRRKSNRTACEYDYIFSSEYISISAVYNGLTRKLKEHFPIKCIYKTGKIDSDTYKRIKLSPDVKVVDYTVNEIPCENKKFFYVAVKDKQEHLLIHLECEERFIINILKTVVRSIVEEGYSN